jgi:hypothetical protein
MLRWSEKWSLASLRHFEDKWNVVDHTDIHWLRGHRRLVFKPLTRLLYGVFPFARGVGTILRPIETALNRFLIRDGRSKTGVEKSARF